METETEVRRALNNLRNSAKDAFGEMTREALKRYAAANTGLLPDDLSQLRSYYETPVDDAILQRYSLLQKGKLADAPQTEFLFAENALPVDDEYDSLYEFRMNGTRANSVSDPGDIVWQGLVQYAKAHNGLLSSDAAALLPYLKRPALAKPLFYNGLFETVLVKAADVISGIWWGKRDLSQEV